MNVLKFHLNQLTKSFTGAVNRLGSFPDEVMCANDRCGAMIPVPHTVFRWVCLNAHENDPTNLTCSQCSSTKKDVVTAGRYSPSVTCPCCNTVTAVPDSNLSASFGASVRRAPQAIAATITRAINDIGELAQKPESFPCQQCAATLLPPTGPWTCQKDNCGQENTDTATNCAKCRASRYATGVVCGVCNRNTYVPTVKAAAGFTSLVHSAHRSVDVTTQYLTGKPYVHCHSCSSIVDITPPKAPEGTEANSSIDVLSPAALENVRCVKCGHVHTYTEANVLRKSVNEFLVAPEKDDEPVASGHCVLCVTTASRVCQCCGKNFCGDHAPFIRKVPSRPLASRRPVCKDCVDTYDRTYMMPTAAAPPAAAETHLFTPADAPVAPVHAVAPTNAAVVDIPMDYVPCSIDKTEPHPPAYHPTDAAQPPADNAPAASNIPAATTEDSFVAVDENGFEDV